MGQGILLEAGTNEMELLIFRLDKTQFGINVAKVREIVQRQKTIAIPQAPDTVEGSFTLRDTVMTLVNLGKHFEMEGEETRNDQGLIIIVEFNNVRCGILVDSVEVIHRLKWDQIEPPSAYLSGLNAPITGVVHLEDNTVLIVDFETIIGEILGIEIQTEGMGESKSQTPPGEVRVLFADDSTVLRSAVTKALKGWGYDNLAVCNDGQQAWDYVEAHREDPSGPCDIVLTDIEMPRMDGLHLTSKIKSDPDLRHIPVVLFSSLISDDNRRKGEQVGADAQISKPNSKEMLESIEACLAKSS